MRRNQMIGEPANNSQILLPGLRRIHCRAGALGFHSVFLVEHHFTGFGRISATLSFLTYLAAKTSTMRLGTAVLVLPSAQPGAPRRAGGDTRPPFQWPARPRHRQGLPVGRATGFCIPMEEAGERYDETVAFLRKAWTAKDRFSHHGKRWHYEDIVVGAGARAKAASAIVGRRFLARIRVPPGGRKRVQPAARVRTAAPNWWPRASASTAGRSKHRAGLRPE